MYFFFSLFFFQIVFYWVLVSGELNFILPFAAFSFLINQSAEISASLINSIELLNAQHVSLKNYSFTNYIIFFNNKSIFINNSAGNVVVYWHSVDQLLLRPNTLILIIKKIQMGKQAF
jgi:hypothetical protein